MMAVRVSAAAPRSATSGVARPGSPDANNRVTPRMVFSGVRISWLMVARNSDFA